MKVHRRSVRLAVGALALLGALAASGVAGASPPQGRSGKNGGGTSWNPDPTLDAEAPVIPDGVTVAQVQAWLSNALELRAQAITTLQGDVTNASFLPDTVRSALLADLTTAANGISSLSTSVTKDSTLGALRSDASSMVLGYRVFAVVQPEVHLTLASERQLAVANHIAHLQPGLETAIKTEEGSAASGTLRSLDAALSNGLSSLEVGAGEVVNDMASVTPSNYVVAAATIAADTKLVSSDWASVSAARSDVRHILSLLAGQSSQGSARTS